MYERILTRAEIKENAKRSLREHRSKAILNWFLYGAILWAASLLVSLIGGNPLGALFEEVINAASGGLSDSEAAMRIAQGVGGAITASLFSSMLLLFVNLVAAPILEYGVYYNSLRLYRNGKRDAMDYKDLFIGFQFKFGRNFGAYLWRALFLLLWGMIPVVGTIIVSVKHYAYCMMPFIIVEHPEIDARQALKESIKLTSGHKWDLFVLDLSFIGWDILSFLTFGLLPIFFLTPYKGLTFAGVYTEYEKNTIGVGTGIKNDLGTPPEHYCKRCRKRIDRGTLCADCASYERPKCPRCGSLLVDGRCPNCTERVERNCVRCGKRIDRGTLCADCASYERPKCPRCGSLLVDGRCPNCTERVEHNCVRCGKRIDRGTLCANCAAADDNLRCKRCGALLFNHRCPKCSSVEEKPVQPQDEQHFNPPEI
jgi:hypothetical protein